MTDLMYAPVVRDAPSIALKDALREELKAAQAEFHALVELYSGPAWRERSTTTEWTFGEVLVHLTWAIEYLPREVMQARKGKGMFNMPKRIADPLSFWYIRWLARTFMPKDIRRRYDRVMDATLNMLDTIQENEWSTGADFYGEGFHSIEDLFHTPAKHIADHTTGWPLKVETVKARASA